MNSGKISGNKAVSNYTYGGGVFVSSISKDEYENDTNPSGFIMNGGEITENISYDGAGVRMSNYDNVQILGGTISGNKCENASGTARPTGVTGIMCDYGASIKMGGKVTITDQISLGYYSTSTGDKHGKIIVVDELDTGDNPLPLRINPDKTKCPNGTVLAEKGNSYTGSLNLSDFAWKYDYNGYENTSRMLTMSDDGTQVLAGTLKSPVRKGSLNLEYEYGIKLGELDFSGYEIYDENGENKLEGSWQITYGTDQTADTVPAIGTHSIKAVFTPNDTTYRKVSVTFRLKVTKMTPSYTVPQGLTAVYGQTLADIALPSADNGVWTWADSTTSVGNFGTNTFNAVFTPNDTTNYNTIENISVIISVSKADPAYTVPEGLTAIYGQTLANVALPSADNGAWTWADSSISVGNVGTNTFKAVFTPNDTNNYKIIETDVSVNVAPMEAGELVTPTLEQITYNPSTTLAGITLPEGWIWADTAIVPTVGNKGYTAYYPVTNSDTTDWSDIPGYDSENKRVERTIALTVNPAAPIVEELPTTGRGRRGYMLSTLSISGGMVTGLDEKVLEGTWTWKTDSVMDSIGTITEAVVFTPADKNYTSIEAEIEVDVNTSGSSSSGSTQLTHYTVSFNTMGGSYIESVRVRANSTLEAPDDPVRDGYEFDGWYTDRSCTERYRFSTKVTKSMTLYAKWIEEDTDSTPAPTSTPTSTPQPTETPSAQEWVNPFVDVQTGNWFYDSVKYVNENGIMQGTEANKFSPNLETTRGMIITMLWRMEGQPNVTNSVFTDVPADSYYAKAIAWGSAYGIVEGYDDGLYRPDQNISRQELAAILYRYAAYSGRNVSQRRDLSGFADAASVSQWASEYMSWAVAEGLIQGTDMNRLEPLSFATRAAAAAMLERFLNN